MEPSGDGFLGRDCGARGRYGAAGRPAAKVGDLLAAHDRERASGRDLLENHGAGEIAILGEGGVQTGDDHGLNLGTTEPRGGLDQLCQIEALGRTSSARQVELEDSMALGCVRKINEEELVEATFAHHFGRKLRDAVAGGDNEHRCRAFL